MTIVHWLLTTALLAGACSSKEDEFACPDGQAMAATGECVNIAGSAEEPASEPEPTTPPDVDSGDSSDALSTDGLDRIQSIFPTAVGIRNGEIPDQQNMANDVELGNTSVGRVLNEAGETLGFKRHVFTPVYCVAGVCEAIRFVMTFTPEYRPLAVYHPNDLEYRLMKYFDGYYEPFNEEDWALLNDVFSNPPDAYAPVESVEEMVDGTHGTAPTLPAFQPITVRGAVFTVWYIIRYGQQTQEILTELEALDALP